MPQHTHYVDRLQVINTLTIKKTPEDISFPSANQIIITSYCHAALGLLLCNTPRPLYVSIWSSRLASLRYIFLKKAIHRYFQPVASPPHCGLALRPEEGCRMAHSPPPCSRRCQSITSLRPYGPVLKPDASCFHCIWTENRDPRHCQAVT